MPLPIGRLRVTHFLWKIRVGVNTRDIIEIFQCVEQSKHLLAGIDLVVVCDRYPEPRIKEIYELDEIELLAPVLPSKVVAVAKNYAKHAEEMGLPGYEYQADNPVFFIKFNVFESETPSLAPNSTHQLS